MFTGPFDSAPRYVGPQLHVASWVLPGSRRVLVTDQSLLSAHCACLAGLPSLLCRLRAALTAPSRGPVLLV